MKIRLKNANLNRDLGGIGEIIESSFLKHLSVLVLRFMLHRQNLLPVWVGLVL